MEDLTKEIKRIIDLPVEDVNIEEAAMLLLRVNRNQILYKNIIHKRNIEKVLYELRKIYNFRTIDESSAKIAEMEKQVIAIIEKNPETTDKKIAEEKIEKGLRADHDQLPEEIKALYLENMNIYPRMRKLHEQLKLMNNSLPCDRYPFLEELIALDAKHRENWRKYNEYKLGQNITKEVVADPKEVSSARKYLSVNKKKIVTMDGEGKQELLDKMQERYNYLVATNAGISDEQIEEYKKLGLNV